MNALPPPMGHNQPTPRELAADVMDRLGKWMAETPVIDNEDTAREAAQWAKRASNCLADIEAERQAKTRPLLDQLATLNFEHKSAIAPLKAVVDELHKRMTTWAVAEEKRRQGEALRARIEADAAAVRAQEALHREAEARANAEVGEVRVDVVAPAIEAQEAALQAQKAERAAARAERDIPVRMAPGMGARAMSLRSREDLQVTDAVAAIAAVGVTEKISEAILTAARAYRKLKGDLPPGVRSITHRSV